MTAAVVRRAIFGSRLAPQSQARCAWVMRVILVWACFSPRRLRPHEARG